MKKFFNIIVLILGVLILSISIFSFFYIQSNGNIVSDFIGRECQSYIGIEAIQHSYFKTRILLNYSFIILSIIGLLLSIISIIALIKNKFKQ